MVRDRALPPQDVRIRVQSLAEMRPPRWLVEEPGEVLDGTLIPGDIRRCRAAEVLELEVEDVLLGGRADRANVGAGTKSFCYEDMRRGVDASESGSSCKRGE